MSNRRATGEDGLTLIEMLIVLSIIAIAAGATVLALAPRRGNATEAEARLLATTMQAAVDRSIATGARPVLIVDDRGYAIGGGARHPLPPDTSLVSAAGRDLSLGFDEARPFDLVIARDRDRWTVSFDGLRVVTTAAKDGG